MGGGGFGAVHLHKTKRIKITSRRLKNFDEVHDESSRESMRREEFFEFKRNLGSTGKRTGSVSSAIAKRG